MKSYGFFKYKELKKDTSKEEIIFKKEACDYTHIEPFVYDDSFIPLMNSIIEDEEFSNYEQPIAKPKIKKVKDSICLWEEFGIKLHDVSCYKHPLLRQIKLVHPSKIPVKLCGFFETGYYSYVDTFYNSLDIVGKGGTIIGTIHLSRTNNILSICGYNHEITHSQLLTDKGSCTDILDCEVLPIFMECVFARRLDPSSETMDMLGKIRISDIGEKLFELSTRNKVSYEERVTIDTYVISSLQAINLVGIYNSGNNKVKKEMLADVRKIFNGMSTVEDMINKYDSSVANVPKDIKRLRKNFII